MSAGLPQLDEHGRLRHLITLDGLGKDLLEALLRRAERFAAAAPRGTRRAGALDGWTVVQLFGEPSTRTRASFELAAVRLGAHVLTLDRALSSHAKGETLADTIGNLEAMSVDVFVIRDATPGVHEQVARAVGTRASVVSGGEAHLSHPTQGLLDALTIRQAKGGFEGLAIAIVGDIGRSRVARSAHHALATLGVQEIRLVGPREMLPAPGEFPGATRFESMDDGIAGADVIMMLRIQHERSGGGREPDLAAYRRDFGLTVERLSRAGSRAVVMHPGPLNRGVEIDSEVADGARSLIRRQVANGVAVRMAVLAEIAEARRKRAA